VGTIVPPFKASVRLPFYTVCSKVNKLQWISNISQYI